MPSVTLTGVNEKLDPLHIAVTVLFAKAGLGLTFTVTLCVFVPFEQPTAINVNMYVTFTGDAVVFVNVSLIVADEPLLAGWLMPVIAARVQLNVVPVVALVAV
jgi:hypothetical protein